MSKLLKTLKGMDKEYTPVWFMRQAGRYLPEFRSLRSKNPDFMKLCLNSDLAQEITLQPIKRFNLDAAIIFSDILVIPHALNQKVLFGQLNGPFIKDFNINKFIGTKKEEFIFKLNPVYEAIKKTKKKLKKEVSLISFIGAPWTLIIYLLNLKKDGLLNETKFNDKKEIINSIFKKLMEFLKIHILYQKEAGADILQIFDSWAGLIPRKSLKEYCYDPNKELVDFCKEIKIPSICFPKGLKKNYIDFNRIVKPNAINIDQDIDPEWAKKNLKNVIIQGGMSPKILLNEENEVMKEVDKFLKIFKDSPYIFNLGHGILPNTNPEIINKIIERVKIVK
mgnify:FL=1